MHDSTFGRAVALTLDARRFPALFRGYGPVPGLSRIEPNSPPGIGATRRVESDDGASMLETITFLQAPSVHAYRLSGIRPPLAWLAEEGHANWAFSAAEGGTDVEWRYEWQVASWWVWPLTWLLLNVFMRGAMRRCLLAMAAEFSPRKETA